MNIINLADLIHEQLINKRGDKYSHTAIISNKLQLQQLFMHYDILEPGKSASAPHYHLHGEEIIIVFEGNPTLTLGTNAQTLKPGDIVGIPAGGPSLHCLRNNSQNIVKFLVINSKAMEKDKVMYAPPVR